MQLAFLGGHFILNRRRLVSNNFSYLLDYMLTVDLGNNFLSRSGIREKLLNEGQPPVDLPLLMISQLAKVISLSRASHCYRPRFNRRWSCIEKEKNQ